MQWYFIVVFEINHPFIVTHNKYIIKVNSSKCSGTLAQIRFISSFFQVPRSNSEIGGGGGGGGHSDSILEEHKTLFFTL